MNTDEYASSMVSDSTNIDNEEFTEMFNNTRSQLVSMFRLPELTTNRPYIESAWTINEFREINIDIQREITNRLAEQIAMDMDNEILNSLGCSSMKDPEDIRDLKTYREEILVKKYGFR